MIEIITTLLFGLINGLKHSLEPDHITAVSTIASKTKSFKKSTFVGILWGCGHTISLFIVGIILLSLKITIPKIISLSFELIIGVMLIVLGVNTFYNLKKANINLHYHDEKKKYHLHSNSEWYPHVQMYKPLIIGLLHGLAGSAALSLIVLSTVNSLLLGMTYILIFGIGSIIGMLTISGVLGLPFVLISKTKRFLKILKISISSISIIIGVTIIYEISILI
jgi:sulfite exporter TauE/SafE